MSVLVVFATLFNHVKTVMAKIADTIITIINTVILTIIYLVFVGLTTLTAKIARKSFFASRNEQAKSYWIEKENIPVKMEDYRKQF